MPSSEQDKLVAAAEALIEQCNSGKLDYQKIRSRKKSPLTLEPIELNVAFETAKGMVAAQAGPHYPAPLTAVKVMQKAATLDREGALLAEHEGFVKLARTEVTANLVQMFLNDQYLGGKAKKYLKQAADVQSAGVLGAGIMGGGIAYQSALKGTPIAMKDVAQKGLDLGMAEARKQFGKRVEKGRMSSDQMLSALTSIQPVKCFSDIVHRKLQEELKKPLLEVKKKVLQSVFESSVAILQPFIVSTAQKLLATEMLPGDVEDQIAKMVEKSMTTRRNDQKSRLAHLNARGLDHLATEVPLATKRILFPYFGAFSRLIHDGADFRQIDKAMEKFGWPMGPAYLLDVVGIDTAVHAQAVMAEGFARMALDFDSAIDKLFASEAYGQKTGSGFYLYEPDKRGKPRKLPNPEIDKLIASGTTGKA